MPAAFSRLQLAAALLEYDNDPDNPDAPRRSAQESAIFAHFRRNPAAPPKTSSRQSDYLGVSLPNETGSLGGRESALDTRRSRGSMDALRNPFGPDSVDGEDDEAQQEGIEVDLSSWGLEAFIPKDKSRKGKGRASSVATNPPMTSVRSPVLSSNTENVALAPRRAISSSRSMSLGGSLDFIRENAASSALDPRRRSIASPLDAANEFSLRPRSSSTSVLQNWAGPSQAIPFPSSSVRATSPGPAEIPGRNLHERTFSAASLNSRMLLADVQEESVHSRPISTLDQEDEAPKEDNPFALQPPSRTSRFDPKYSTHPRTISNASMGTHAVLNDDRNSVMTGGDFNQERRYSTTLDLLRPKVLVMPSPLQSVAQPTPHNTDNRVRDGFMLSKDGPPLPPGARTSRRISIISGVLDQQPPIASNSFTPNPLNDLTYAQKLFRNTLPVDGQSDAYNEGLPRATQDGEQIQLYPTTPEAEESIPLPSQLDASTTKRLPGKLYGKSLIDDLETRKAQMRSKQRVFTGDQRPSMMARNDIQRSSTFIDPATLSRPVSQHLNALAPSEGGLMRRNSGNIQPLLSFENDKIPISAPMPGRPINSRSVFGTDTIWEREMARLREIEAEEKLAEEERMKYEEAEEQRRVEKKNKKKRKNKKAASERPEQSSDMAIPQPENTEPKVSMEPPVLPVIDRAVIRPPPPPTDNDDDDSESDDEEDHAVVSANQLPGPAWHAGSSDEEDIIPRRTTGVGLRYPNKSRKAQLPMEAESDEDLPLAVTVQKALGRPLNAKTLESDDEEEKPLAAILDKKAKVKESSSLLNINFDKLFLKDNPTNIADGDDDDQPLALRASRIPLGFNSVQDEDDMPLALHPDQQRRTQSEMMLRQQQQMMMQAQMHNSMFFNPTMMGSGFFGPQVAPPMMHPINPMMMMQPPMPIPSPPPIQDPSKFGLVDKWRRDVAVEGER